ncbi:N-acetyltransferase [Gemmobacter lutimaris]|uniref:N-acetyltransferase n=1 Tax=Gemmobacter lutimaris TaxID=2306023 RepID=A0A398BTM1_9RHOB|nr:N-acetyltransferase [Gemmobacter lutimaris]RID91798.1 N-acetyltransferase [Gemmobacter lutimaris]
MTPRLEGADEAAAISRLIAEAFATAPHADGNEAEIVAALRTSGDLLLSLVCEDGHGLTGHIAASPVTIGGTPGWACIAPVSVAPRCQQQGIGQALMRAALAALQAQGHGGVVILGGPAYYGRFGLVADPARRLPGVPPEYLLSRAFTTPAPTGDICFAPAFGPL